MLCECCGHDAADCELCKTHVGEQWVCSSCIQEHPQWILEVLGDYGNGKDQV